MEKQRSNERKRDIEERRIIKGEEEIKTNNKN